MHTVLRTRRKPIPWRYPRIVRSREVFEGLARSFVAMKDYDKAAEQLNLWLEDNQEDVAAWLNLGDVEMWRGDELRARLLLPACRFRGSQSQ